MLKNPIIGVGTFNPSPRAKELVLQALDNHRLSYGPLTQQFEAAIARHHGCRFGVMSNSGTSALHVAVASLKEIHGWEDGDEILVPAMTFIATSNVVLHNNMTPVFVDVDPVYYGMDPTMIEEKLSSRTRAIIPVHVFGHPADMNPIREIAGRKNLKIIEDSCETMFAGYKGERVGSMGDIGCFSTYIAHLIVTGVGGLNTTNNPEYAIKLRSLVNHGRDSLYLNIDDDDAVTTEELRVIVGRRFSFVSVGHSFRVTEMEAALGLAQLDDWESIISRRRANARRLSRELTMYNDRMQLPAIRPGCEHSFMMYPIVLRDQAKMDLVHYLEEHGVETREMLPLIGQPVYQQLLRLREEDFPVARWVTDNGFYIGCHQDLTDSDMDYIIELFARFWKPRDVAPQRETSLLVLLITEGGDDVRGILEFLPLELFDEVVAFTNGVTDDLAEIMETYGIRLEALQHQDPVHYVAQHNMSYDNVIYYPADGSYDARDIAKLLFALETGNQMAIASRFLPGGFRHDRVRRFRYRSLGNRIFTVVANILFYGNLTDTVCRFRGMKLSVLKSVSQDYAGLILLYQLSISAMKLGWQVKEIPTREAVDLSSRHQRRAWQSVLPMLRVLIREWFRRDGTPVA